MIVIPQGKKIVIIAVSLFVTTFSTVLYFVSGGEHLAESGKSSVLESFFRHGEENTAYLEQPQPALAVSSNGSIVDVNEAFTERLHYALPDLTNKSLFSLISPKDLPAFAADLATISKDGKVIVNAGPYRFMNSDGRDHVVLVSFSTLKGEAGSDRVILLVLKDITDSLDEKKDGKPTGKSIKDTEDSKDQPKRIIVEKTG